MDNYQLRDEEHRSIAPASLRRKIFLHVALIHVVLIFGPLGYFAISDLISPPKQNAFRVKIGPKELSHGPEVGHPERIRPGANKKSSGVDKPKEPPKPKQPPKPKEPPKPKQPAKPKEPPKPKQVQKPKPTPKPTPKPKQVQPPKKTTTAKKSDSKSQTKPNTGKPKTVAEAEQQVYRPAGGSNFNRNVAIGTRDRAQALGKQDNRTPGGGASEKMEKYGQTLGTYLETRWSQPPDILLQGERPSVLIELDIAPDGRITGSRIIQLCGNQAMNESVKLLLRNLDRVPAPPEGKVSLQISMQTH